MAVLASLEDMVRAIAGSIMNAQHLVEKAQIANIASFFDDQHQPTAIDLKLPSIHSKAKEGDTYHYRLPLISIVQHSSLIIGEAEIDLDVELGAYAEQARSNVHESIMGKTGLAAPAEKKAGLMVNPETGGVARRSGSVAHIKLKVVSAEKTEGLARLINDVIKSQGYTGTTDQD